MYARQSERSGYSEGKRTARVLWLEWLHRTYGPVKVGLWRDCPPNATFEWWSAHLGNGTADVDPVRPPARVNHERLRMRLHRIVPPEEQD